MLQHPVEREEEAHAYIIGCSRQLERSAILTGSPRHPPRIVGVFDFRARQHPKFVMQDLARLAVLATSN